MLKETIRDMEPSMRRIKSESECVEIMVRHKEPSMHRVTSVPIKLNTILQPDTILQTPQTQYDKKPTVCVNNFLNN